MKPIGLLALQALAGWLSWRNFHSIPELSENPERPSSESVSIVIPARNEADRLPLLLDSLNELHCRSFDVLVVDDQSEDETSGVAAHRGAKILSGSLPPPGWSGKCWACQQGADATTGDWILFTDADTIHGPHSLERALAAALARRADILSLLPRQRCETFWERLLVPYVHALYFVGAWRVNMPGGPVVANGQYLLFRRAAYDRIGGHRSIRGSLIDDVDIGTRAVTCGMRVVLLRAERDVEVRMYNDLPSLWQGFSKNAFRFMKASPRSGIPSVIATGVFVAAVPSLLTARSRLLRISLYLVPGAALLPWERKSRISLLYAALHPLAAVTFQVLALDSIRRTVFRRGTVWKGRRY